MDPFKTFVLIAAMAGVLIFLSAASRLIYLLVTRKELDVASVEMKSYLCGFIVVIAAMLCMVTVTGVAPARHGVRASAASDPFLFTILVAKILGWLALSIYVCAKVWRRKTWVLQIRR